MSLDVSALSAFNNEVAGELLPKIVYGVSPHDRDWETPYTILKLFDC